VHAHGADLDDAVGLRIEPGGLEVEGDEVQMALDLAPPCGEGLM
jgi:hypothetical protein